MNQPNLWGFDANQIGGQVSNSHPSTSLKAAIKVKSGSQKAQALLALYDSEGLTAYRQRLESVSFVSKIWPSICLINSVGQLRNRRRQGTPVSLMFSRTPEEKLRSR